MTQDEMRNFYLNKLDHINFKKMPVWRFFVPAKLEAFPYKEADINLYDPDKDIITFSLTMKPTYEGIMHEVIGSYQGKEYPVDRWFKPYR
jgi:hypothetical protein